MKEEQIKDTIIEILGKIVPEADLDTLSLQQDLRATLDIDSFDFLNFIIGLNEKLGVNIPESDYGKLLSLSDMLNYLSERVD